MSPVEFQTIIRRLRKQGTDDAQVEVKKCTSELSKDIWECVSTFGNTYSPETLFSGIRLFRET